MELAGYEHGCHSKQLKLPKGNILNAEIPVNDVDCNEERFRQQFELNLHQNQPVN